ncbi:MAG TPA: GIY-YIG nuclease family protein [Solirubrobacterales bacterium]|nr:GIY-YIG nuclease family protein [Solirubrobacterales bacterium]
MEALRRKIAAAFKLEDSTGRKAGDAKFGVYAFFDYDGEPIYVGRTREGLRTRIRRHLTNQRTDAVAMSVLDPFEVLDIKMWPLWELEDKSLSKEEKKRRLGAAERAVFDEVLEASSYGAVLNEKDIEGQGDPGPMPTPVEARIIPDELIPLRKHPDVRIARRANTIASLAKAISERDPSKGLRRTLVTQARRLERLAADRHDEVAGKAPTETPDEETGEEAAPGDQED